MAYTDHSDIFGSIHEDGINRVVRHIMQQRPSLFNYATPVFHNNPGLFCEPIQPAPQVIAKGNPLFTEQSPLPILGAPVPIGLNFCFQLTDVQIDFHPTSAFELPPELGEGKLNEQQFAFRAKACAGIDCPTDDLIEQLLPTIERIVVAQKQKDQPKSARLTASNPTRAELSASEQEPSSAREGEAYIAAFAPQSAALDSYARLNTATAAVPNRQREIIALPTRKLLCFCLELFVVGHFEWGTVADPNQQWLKPRLDGIEIVDLQPTPMENAIECYAATVLRLGILPRLMMPMEAMILDITKVLQKQGITIGKQITLGPSEVPADVPNNPAIEDNMLKAFIKMTVTP